MSSFQYQPHGKVSAHLAGRVLYIECTGPFNAELIEAVVRAYQPLIERLAGGGPYGHISIFHRSMLATPEALVALDLLLAEWRRSGLAPVANAYVAAADVDGRRTMMPLFARVFEGFSRFRDFHAVADAERWIDESLGKSAP